MPRKTYEEVCAEIERLKATPGNGALLELIGHTTSPNSWVRRSAVEAVWDHWLNRLSDRQAALTAVRAAVTDASWEVRDTAAEALGDMGNRSDVHRLLVAAQDDEWCVRCSAADSLAEIGGKKALRKVCQMLADDPEACVRMWASGATGEYGREDCIGTLLEAEPREDHPMARTGILQSLLRFGRTEFLDAYLELLQCRSQPLPALAVHGLISLIQEEALVDADLARGLAALGRMDPESMPLDQRAAVLELLAQAG